MEEFYTTRLSKPCCNTGITIYRTVYGLETVDFAAIYEAFHETSTYSVEEQLLLYASKFNLERGKDYFMVWEESKENGELEACHVTIDTALLIADRLFQEGGRCTCLQNK